MLFQRFKQLPRLAKLFIIPALVVGTFSLSAAGGAASTLLSSASSSGTKSAIMGDQTSDDPQIPDNSAIIKADGSTPLAPPDQTASPTNGALLTEVRSIAFTSREVTQSCDTTNKKVTTKGVSGSMTITYKVTNSNGKPVKTEVSRKVTKQPVTQVTTACLAANKTTQSGASGSGQSAADNGTSNNDSAGANTGATPKLDGSTANGDTAGDANNSVTPQSSQVEDQPPNQTPVNVDDTDTNQTNN